MSVYVDPLFRAFRSPLSNVERWCHLFADTEEELHAFAAELGMKRAWFQDKPGLPHYDLTPGRRTLALRRGAVEIPSTKVYLRAKRRNECPTS